MTFRVYEACTDRVDCRIIIIKTRLLQWDQVLGRFLLHIIGLALRRGDGHSALRQEISLKGQCLGVRNE
jgi:hypothetical protein